MLEKLIPKNPVLPIDFELNGSTYYFFEIPGSTSFVKCKEIDRDGITTIDTLPRNVMYYYMTQYNRDIIIRNTAILTKYVTNQDIIVCGRCRVCRELQNAPFIQNHLDNCAYVLALEIQRQIKEFFNV